MILFIFRYCYHIIWVNPSSNVLLLSFSDLFRKSNSTPQISRTGALHHHMHFSVILLVPHFDVGGGLTPLERIYSAYSKPRQQRGEMLKHINIFRQQSNE